VITLAALVLTAPTAERPYAGRVEVRGASFAIIGTPADLIAGVEIGSGWAAFPDADGLIAWSVDPAADQDVTAVVYHGPPPTDPADPWPSDRVAFALPVTREHRIETAVRLWIESQRQLQAIGANVHEIAAQQARILQEPAR